MSQRFEVTGVQTGMRLDAFVAHVGDCVVRAARDAIADGRVRVKDKRAVKGLRLVEGDWVEVDDLATPTLPVIEPCFTVPLDVLHEDDDIVAINKPVGMATHPLRAGEEPSAAAILIARFPSCALAADNPREAGLGHRLDRSTGGVLIAAKHSAAWKALRRGLGGGGATKVYLAEVVGVPPAHQVIDAPIGHGGIRGSMARVGTGRGLLPAETIVDRVEQRAQTALVKATLSTGRQHQVRVHLAHVGRPILGDQRYGNRASLQVSEALAVAGARLFALSVTFDHPMTGMRMTIEAPRPSWAIAVTG